MSDKQQGGPEKFTPEQVSIMERFLQQAGGTAEREYSAGRIALDDEGSLALAIVTDKARKTIIIRFGKPVEWIGLGVAETRGLIQLLSERLKEIDGTTSQEG
jgi:hypothetical protein